MRRLSKIKIRRKYTDFYTAEDIQEPDSPEPNLSIDNFDRKGLIVNPEAPCLAITIDPEYVRDCNKPLKIRKFLVKSDILTLRNITRTKFFSYSTKERAYEKECEQEINTRIYEETKKFYEFCYKNLKEGESSAFQQMRERFDELQALEKTRPSDERSRLELEHQKVYTEVFEIYRKFRYLLKLIDYFDNVSEDSDNIEKLSEILKKEMNLFLTSIPDKHSIEESQKLLHYMENLIKPYLAKRRYLDSDIWRKGYESIRRRTFNYNRHLTRVALLNHIVIIIYEKFMKFHNLRLQPKIFLKKSQVVEMRSAYLKTRTSQMLNDWENEYKSDTTNMLIAAVVPTVTTHLGLNDKRPDGSSIISTDPKSMLEQSLLNELDSVPPDLCRQLEKKVRRDMEREKKLAKQALVKQTRLRNLLDHYKNHYKKKNIVHQYTTLIPRRHGKKYAANMSKSELSK